MINDTFGNIVFVQLCTSSICLSTCIFEVAVDESSSNQAARLMLFSFYFIQLFCYSYFGERITREAMSKMLKEYKKWLDTFKFLTNVLKLQSENLYQIIYQMNWTILTKSSIKDLTFMMKRSLKPMRVQGNSLSILSLSSSLKVSKINFVYYFYNKNLNKFTNILIQKIFYSRSWKCHIQHLIP